MNYNELLNQYLDGTLSEAEQQVFFSALADNVAFRQEFNDEMLVRTAVQSSILAEAPPAALTNSVFTAVGYSSGSAAAAPTGVVIPTSGLIKFGGYLLSFVAGCIAIWLWNPWGNNSGNLQNSLTRSAQVQNQQFSGNNNTTSNNPLLLAQSAPVSAYQNQNAQQYRNNPLRSSSEGDAIRDMATQKRNFGKKRNPSFGLQNNFLNDNGRSNDNPTPTNTAIVNQKNATDNEQLLSQNKPVQPDNGISSPNKVNISSAAQEVNSQDSYSTPKQQKILQELQQQTTPSDNKLIVSLRSLQTFATAEDIGTNNKIGINNIALAVLYRLNTNFAVGAEVGHEPFYQQYSYKTDSSTNYVKQNPTLAWAGPVVRFSVPSFGWKEVLYPFAQAGGGYAESSQFYMYGTAGICFAPVDMMSMTLGGGMTYLSYSVNSTPYNTQKWGWSYSMNVHF